MAALKTSSPSQHLQLAVSSKAVPQASVVSVRLPAIKARKVSQRTRSRLVCSVAAEVSPATATNEGSWVKVFSVEDIPKGERRLVRQGNDTVLVFWYRNELRAVENLSPAEGAYSEGLFNARLTQEGGITCPTSDSVFDLKTGEALQWYPNNWVMRTFTSPLRSLQIYDVKVEDGQVLVDFGAAVAPANQAEVYGAEVKVGQTASDVNVNETRMVVDEDAGGFGFTKDNELTNGRAAMMGFVLLLINEVVTGKGLLAATGFLDFLYRSGLDGPLLK